MDKIFEPMKQYFLDRDLFCKAFHRYLPNFEDILSDNGYNLTTDNFKMFRVDDEFYVLHLPSGIMINWYKHLGRTNTCNKDLTFNQYAEFLLLLRRELKEGKWMI